MQSGQDGCECYWTWYKGLDGQIVESVMSLATVCQFLGIVAVNSLPMSEIEVTTGRMLVIVCGVFWDSRLLGLWVKAGIFMFLMIRCSGYARASRMRVRLLSSSCRIWSSEMIMLYLN